MNAVRPNTDSRIDRPNGDLKPGDMVLVTKWCKEKSYIMVSRGGGLISQETVAEPVDDERRSTKPNTAMFGDVFEILAIDYPWAIIDVHSVSYSGVDYRRNRWCMDLTEFECRPAGEAYVAAVLSGNRPDPAAAASPAEASRTGSRFGAVMLVLAFVGAGVAVAVMIDVVARVLR